MMVEHLWLNGSLVDLDTGKKSYAINFDKKTPGWEDLSKVACLCSNAEFKPEDLVKPRFLELGHIGIFLSLSSRSCLGP